MQRPQLVSLVHIVYATARIRVAFTEVRTCTQQKRAACRYKCSDES
jgi:hypothetical protein